MKEAANNQFEAVGDATSAFSKGIRKSFNRSSKEMRGFVRSFGDMMDMEDVLKSIHKVAYPTDHARSSNIIHPSIDWSNPNARRAARMQTSTVNALHSAVNISISNAIENSTERDDFYQSQVNVDSPGYDDLATRPLSRQNSTPSKHSRDYVNRCVSNQAPSRSASFSMRSKEHSLGREIPTRDIARRHLDVENDRNLVDRKRERLIKSERDSLEISDPEAIYNQSYTRRSSSFSNRDSRQYNSPPSSGVCMPTKELARRHRETQDAKDLAERKREQLSLSARNSLELSDSDSNYSQQSPRSASFTNQMEGGRYESPPLSRGSTPTKEIARKHREAQDAKDLAERKRERLSHSARNSVELSDMDRQLSPRSSSFTNRVEGHNSSAPSSRVGTPTREIALRHREAQHAKDLAERKREQLSQSQRSSIELSDVCLNARVIHDGGFEKDLMASQANVYITRSPVYSQENNNNNVSPVFQEHLKYLEQLEHNPKSSLFRSNSPTSGKIKTKSFLQIESSTFKKSPSMSELTKSDASSKVDFQRNASVSKNQRKYTDELNFNNSLLRVNGALANSPHRHSYNGDQQLNARNDTSLRRSASMRVAKSSARQQNEGVVATRVCSRSASMRVEKQTPMYI